MGSIETYDFKQRKWVPYLSTPEDVEHYFQKMDTLREEKQHGPGHMARRLRDTEEKLNDTQKQLEEARAELKRKTPQVTQVTPVAQAIEMAQAEVNEARKKASGQKRKKTLGHSSLPKRYKGYPHHGTIGSF